MTIIFSLYSQKKLLYLKGLKFQYQSFSLTLFHQYFVNFYLLRFFRLFQKHCRISNAICNYAHPSGSAYVCGRSPAEIVGSNPTGVMDVCLLRVLCVVR